MAVTLTVRGVYEIFYEFLHTKLRFETNWWTPEDKAAFNQRLQKLIDYFDNITVFEGVNCDGDMVSAEATADITGMQAILKLASTKEGFDYDRFFRK